MTERMIYTGNAATDGIERRGWVVGHFMPPGDPRHSDEVEIRWAVHPKGEQRAEWVTGETRSSVLMLISGRFRVELPERSVLLAEPGDYVVFHRVDHSWRAEEPSIVLGMRWPSIPGYALP